jgi:serine/threonine protein kinase
MGKGWSRITAHARLESDGEVVRKLFVKDYFGFTKEELWGNELSALVRLVGGVGVQELLSADRSKLEIVTRDGGEPGVVEYGAQGLDILEELDLVEVVHRDIRPDNLVVRDGVLTLIDFEWSVFPGSVMERRNPPSVLGEEYRSPRGFDDRYSMERSLRG